MTTSGAGTSGAPGPPRRHWTPRRSAWCGCSPSTLPDANGRTARLLAECDLVAAGLLPGLLLDLEGWTERHRAEHDRAVVAAAQGRLAPWGELFARTVTDTARHRTTTVETYGALIDAAIARTDGDAAETAVLTCLRTARPLHDLAPRPHPARPGPTPRPPRTAGILTPHPRLPGALIHPQSWPSWTPRTKTRRPEATVRPPQPHPPQRRLGQTAAAMASPRSMAALARTAPARSLARSWSNPRERGAEDRRVPGGLLEREQPPRARGRDRLTNATRPVLEQPRERGARAGSPASGADRRSNPASAGPS